VRWPPSWESVRVQARVESPETAVPGSNLGRVDSRLMFIIVLISRDKCRDRTTDYIPFLQFMFHYSFHRSPLRVRVTESSSIWATKDVKSVIFQKPVKVKGEAITLNRTWRPIEL
jgi:hypothetical protein